MTEKEKGIVKSEQIEVLTIESNVMMVMMVIMMMMVVVFVVVVMMMMMMMMMITTTTTTTTTAEELFRTWFTLLPVLYSHNST